MGKKTSKTKAKRKHTYDTSESISFPTEQATERVNSDHIHVNTTGSTSTNSETESPTDKKRKYDRHFHGPVRKRSCTDALFLLLFLFFFIGLILVAGWSTVMGDARRILYPKDSHGKVCGLDHPDKPVLFFFDMMSCTKIGKTVSGFGCSTPQVCIRECPTYSWTSAMGDTENSREKMICEGGINANHPSIVTQPANDLIENNQCAEYVIPSEDIFLRCVPKLLVKNNTAGFYSLNRDIIMSENSNISLPFLFLASRSWFSRMVEDLSRTWALMIVCMLIAAVISFLWVVLIRYFARFMIVVTLLVLLSLIGFVCAFSFMTWYNLQYLSGSSPPFYFTINLFHYFKYATAWMVIGILTAILLVIVILILITIRKRIALAADVIVMTSRAIASMPSILIFPIIPFLLMLSVVILGMTIDIQLRSIVVANMLRFNTTLNEPEERFSKDWIRWTIQNTFQCRGDNDSVMSNLCVFVNEGKANYIPVLQIYNLCMLLWLINFILALGKVTMAGAFAIYYFSRRSLKKTKWPVTLSFWRALRYHMGSMAFGSFLISLLSLLRSTMLYFESKFRFTNSPLLAIFAKIFFCCFWILDWFLRYITRNAYIIIAIHGCSFLRAAHDAFGLVLRNVTRIVVVDKITDFILFIGKLCVAIIPTVFGYFILQRLTFWKFVLQPSIPLNYFWMPLLLIFLGAYVVASAFFSVFQVGVETVLICFCEDLERNDGSSEKPYFSDSATLKALKKRR